MKVRATKLGYYGDKRRVEGSLFHLKTEDHFSEAWMVEHGKKSAEAEEAPAKPAKKGKKKVSKAQAKAPEEAVKAEPSDSSAEVI